jgi:transposase
MKEQKKKKRANQKLLIMNPKVAGIDVGASCHYVCVGNLSEESIRRFGTFTQDLEALADWLVSLGVESVAMESTGIYWVNLYDTLESRGLELCLANARYVRNVPGRKSDVSDSEWIQQLHSYGLLSGSFIATGKIRELRAYVRQRENLEQQKSMQLNLMGKSLQLLNVKLHQVSSNLEIQVCMKIIRAIVDGERDAKKLADHRHPQMKASKEDLEKSLAGNWRSEHLFSLKQGLTFYDFIKTQMLLCEGEIEGVLQEMNQKNMVSSQRPKQTLVRQNDYHFDVKNYLKEITGIDLTKIDGLSEKTILTILSETGSDLSRWKTAEHFTSWLGLAPKMKKSGEKVIGHFKQSVANRANQAFRMAAWALTNSKSYLGEFYRKLAFRRGTLTANKATARKIAVVFWNMMCRKTDFIPQSQHDYEEKYKQKQLLKLEKQAAKLGLVLQKL